MAEMDPIIRDALKRSSQMQGYGVRQQQTNNQKRQEKPEPKQMPKEESKQEQSFKMPEIASAPKENPINMLFRDKEQSIILLLVVLLMNEDNDPMLLLALMYLLI